MPIETLNLITGTLACDADCPFCVARMTPSFGLETRVVERGPTHFDEVLAYAIEEGVGTVIITGKGEPTLFPEEITAYLRKIRRHGFRGAVELQTNGIGFTDRRDHFEGYLEQWRALGLSRIAVSIVHWESERNREIYVPHRSEYPDLPGLVEFLTERPYGFAVRLTCVAMNGYVDGVPALESLIAFSRAIGVDQLTIRPVGDAYDALDANTARYARLHALTADQTGDIERYLDHHGRLIRVADYGARFYELSGLQVALTSCLSRDASSTLRHALYFPDGSLRTSWEDAATIDPGARSARKARFGSIGAGGSVTRSYDTIPIA